MAGAGGGWVGGWVGGGVAGVGGAARVVTPNPQLSETIARDTGKVECNYLQLQLKSVSSVFIG